MTDARRVQKLEALLARVRANARRADAPLADAPPPVVEPGPVPEVVAAPFEDAFASEDRWEPDPAPSEDERREVRAALERHVERELSGVRDQAVEFPSEKPPVHDEASRAPAPLQVVDAYDRAVVTGDVGFAAPRLPVVEPPVRETIDEPTSAIEQAFDLVVRAPKPEPAPREFWDSVTSDLRSRRSAEQAAPPASSDATEGQGADIQAEREPPASPESSTLSRRVRRRAHRLAFAPRGLSHRLERTSRTRRWLAYVGVALATAAMVAVGFRFLDPEEATSSHEASPSTRATTEAPEDARPSELPSPGRPPGSATESPPEAPRGEAAPDPAKLGDGRAFVLIEAEARSTVYLGGTMVGETGRWLEVECGFHFVRLAKTGAPPPGGSFPQWETQGVTVLFPCREASRIPLGS